MRILIVHNEYNEPGGEDRVVANEIRMLTEHGHEVLLYERSNEDLADYKGLNKRYLPGITEFNERTYRDVVRILGEEKVDLVHVHNVLHLVSPAVYYAALEMGVPVVKTLHNYRLFCPAGMFYRDGHVCEDCVHHGFSQALLHRCYRGSLTQTAVLSANLKKHLDQGIYENLYYICLSDFMKKKVASFYPALKDRLYVKENAAFPKKTAVLADTGAALKTQTEERKKRYLFAGRLSEEKGIGVLLKGFLIYEKRCKARGKDPCDLYICGQGPLRDRIKRQIASIGCDRIRLMGQLEKERLNSLMGEVRALILPSLWYEADPMVIAESYAAHTPVIGSDLGSVGARIKKEKTGLLFEPGNAEGLAEALMKMDAAYASADAAAMIRNVRLQDTYLPEKNVETLMRIYRDVLFREGKESSAESE